jgi:hypothetical protein
MGGAASPGRWTARWIIFRTVLTLIPTEYIPTTVRSSRGRCHEASLQRDRMRRPRAEVTQPSHPGGAGSRPEALGPPARSSLMAGHWLARRSNDAMLRKGSRLRGLREKRWQPKARSGTRHTPPWRAERRGCFGDKALSHTKTGAPIGAPHPRLFRGQRGITACPGPQTIRAA